MRSTHLLTVIIIIATLLGACKSKKKDGEFAVELEVYTSSDYCGGAAPTDEIMKELTKSSLFTNGTLYFVLRNDEGGAVKEFTVNTNAKGKFKIYLTPGMYDIYLKSKDDRKKVVESVEENFRECTGIFMEQAPGHVHVWSDVKQKIDLHTMCNPCLPPAP